MGWDATPHLEEPMPSKTKKKSKTNRSERKKPAKETAKSRARSKAKKTPRRSTRRRPAGTKSKASPPKTDKEAGGKGQKKKRKEASSRSVADLLNKKWDHPVFKGFGRPLPAVRAVYAVPFYALRGSGTWLMVCNPQASATQACVILFDDRGQPLHRRDFSVPPNGIWQLTVLDHVDEGIGYSLLMTTAPVIVYEQFYRLLGGQVLGATQSRVDNMLEWRPTKNPRTYGFGFRTIGDSYESPVVALLLSNPTTSRWSGYLQLGDEEGKVQNPKRLVIDPGATREVRIPSGRAGLGRLQTSDPCGLMLMHFSGNPLEITAADLLGKKHLVEPAPGIRQRQGRVYVDRGHITSWYRLEEGYWQPLLGLLQGLTLKVTLGDAYPLTPQVLENQDVVVLSAPERAFTAAEERVLRDFVSQGGSLLVEGEWGPTPQWTPVNQQVLGLFGASSDENLARDPRHNIYDTPTRIKYEKERNFLPHPISEDIDLVVTNAGSTLMGDDTWTPVIRTSAHASPANRPVMLTRAYGFGRVAAIGDTNAWIPGEAERPMDVPFTRAVFEWLLFKR
jgi:hypothetical protein